ncbi:hypothetical protein KXQ82_12945 [Mucilaginibacter sp. HMF5004]|uniref:hypothetical protein n=1 Tax=Mucilaginibacter rivuli TaxID=2857527 RepID=UPI001C5EB5ED|nr:hypothetical protein [Mucilaginibacter rivuli]MBW4890635.1 hypothetical protein [Mucilaginibacter rivuli]
MKRVALLLLTFAYLVSVTGFKISSMTCLGKLSSIKAGYRWAGMQAKTCTNMTGCCSRTQHVFKVNDAHVGTVSLSLNKPYAGGILLCFSAEKVLDRLSLNVQQYVAGDSEPGPPACIYKLQHNYRI